MGNVKYFKLTSGEEFMGEIIDADDLVTVINNPAILIPHPQDPGKALLQPWGPLQYMNGTEIAIKNDTFAMKPEDLKPELEKLYAQAIGKIQIAPAGLLTELHTKH